MLSFGIDKRILLKYNNIKENVRWIIINIGRVKVMRTATKF